MRLGERGPINMKQIGSFKTMDVNIEIWETEAGIRMYNPHNNTWTTRTEVDTASHHLLNELRKINRGVLND